MAAAQNTQPTVITVFSGAFDRVAASALSRRVMCDQSVRGPSLPLVRKACFTMPRLEYVYSFKFKAISETC